VKRWTVVTVVLVLAVGGTLAYRHFYLARRAGTGASSPAADWAAEVAEISRLGTDDPEAAAEQLRRMRNPKRCPTVVFRGTVESVGIGRAEGPGVLTLDFDANWVISIRVKSLTPENPHIRRGQTAWFNVHSPVRTLGLSSAEAVGRTADFEIIVRETTAQGMWTSVDLSVPLKIVDGKLVSGWDTPAGAPTP